MQTLGKGIQLKDTPKAFVLTIPKDQTFGRSKKGTGPNVIVATTGSPQALDADHKLNLSLWRAPKAGE